MLLTGPYLIRVPFIRSKYELVYLISLLILFAKVFNLECLRIIFSILTKYQSLKSENN